MIMELVRIKRLTGDHPREIFSDAFLPADGPFILVETFAHTSIPKTIYALNVQGIEEAYYAKKITTRYGEKEIGTIYTLSRFSKDTLPLCFPKESGTVTIEGSTVPYYRIDGALFTKDPLSLEYFPNKFVYERYLSLKMSQKTSSPEASAPLSLEDLTMNDEELSRLWLVQSAILDSLIPYSEGEELDEKLLMLYTVRKTLKEKNPTALTRFEEQERLEGSALFAAIKIAVWEKRAFTFLSDVNGQTSGGFALLWQRFAGGELTEDALLEALPRESGSVQAAALERIDMDTKKTLAQTNASAMELIEAHLEEQGLLDSLPTLDEIYSRYPIDTTLIPALL